ncbi:MAG TPA: sigma-70 family RNA polymerase sigma factor [Bryobacteraceae bacterium]|nr:sigma-70 family RNA polymerase sigma factor [Bryobacteraceae bacterium]
MQSLNRTFNPPDRVLVDSARLGDKEAFGELVRRHNRRCVELATMYLRNHCDAEDQVQIALLKAHMHLAQYQGEAEFVTWLLRIVVNQCLMFMRDKRRAHFVYLDDDSRGAHACPLELRECGPDPERESASNQMKEVLSTEIRGVPLFLRKAILLRDIQELPMSAVAEALQISVPAAKSRLLRARIELRLRLKRHHDNIATLSPLPQATRSLNQRSSKSSAVMSA